MTITVKQIQSLKDYLINVLHSKRIEAQKIDQQYIDDTFTVPFIKEGVDPVRVGKGYRMVSAPAEHIITDNPQVFRNIIRGKGNTEANQRVTSELNRWIKVFCRQQPHPIKENVKKILGRGESWLYVIHNNKYDPQDPNEIPIALVNLDPLIVYADRGEKNGIPSRIMVCYDQVAGEIQNNYPYWTWKNRRDDMKETDRIPFFMYWDKEVRYFEADTEPLLTDLKGNLSNGDGLQENIYGFVPFVHAYSGFGEGSADGDPVNLAVGRLRKCRNLIGEYTAVRSTLDHIIFQYAHSPMDLLYDPSIWTPPPDFAEKYSREPGSFNVVPITPNGKLTRGIDMLPDQVLFQYLAKLESDIDREDPLGTVSQVLGTSGRQQDQVTDASLRRFKTVVENCSHAFATALGLGLRIVEKLPQFKPESIHDDDIAGYYDCKVELKAEDPIDQDRLRTLGERLYMNGQIDLETNLVRYQGYTNEEAREIMDKILAENIIKNDPWIAAALGEQAAKEMGMADIVNAMKQRRAMAEQTPVASDLNTVKNFGSQGGEPRMGNIKSPTGMEMSDMSLVARGNRRSPGEGE